MLLPKLSLNTSGAFLLSCSVAKRELESSTWDHQLKIKLSINYPHKKTHGANNQGMLEMSIGNANRSIIP